MGHNNDQTNEYQLIDFMFSICRNKFQSQLELLFKKYNQTMADKTTEELYFNEKYDEVKLDFDEFMIEYNREQAAYDQLVGQWEKKRREQITLFTTYYAARRIQRWWRRFIREQKKKARIMGQKNKKAIKGKAIKAVKEQPKKEIKDRKGAGNKKEKKI